MQSSPFTPAYGSGQTVSPAASAAVVTLNQGDQSVVLTNTGASICYVRISDAGNATTADYPIVAGAQVCLTKGSDQQRLSHISATGTTLHIITGNGW